MSESEDRLEWIPTDKFIPNDWNPQTMDQPTFTRLCREIRETSFSDALTVIDQEDGTYLILGGYHRWRAAQHEGIDKLPALVKPKGKWSEDYQKFVTVRLNVLKGEIDPEKFIALKNSLHGRYNEEVMQDMFAMMDQKYYKKLVGKVGRSLKGLVSDQKQKEFEARAQTAETVNDLSQILGEILNEKGHTLSQGYMVFSFGKKTHIYVEMTSPVVRQMHRVLDYCEASGVNLNEFMLPLIGEFAEKAENGLIDLVLNSPEPEEDGSIPF